MATAALAGRSGRLLVAGAGGVEGLATFTGTDGTALTAYTADSGFGLFNAGISDPSYVLSSGVAVCTSTAGTLSGARGAGAVASDDYTLYADLVRGNSTAANTGLGIFGRSTGGGAASSRSVGVWIAPNTDGTTVTLQVVQWSGGSRQPSDLTTSFALAPGDGLRFGHYVNGATVTAWSEPYGGGARVTYPAVTLPLGTSTGDYNSTDNAYVLLVSTRASDQRWDNLTMLGGQAVPMGELRGWTLEARRPNVDATSNDSAGAAETLGGIGAWTVRAPAIHLNADVAHTALRDALLLDTNVYVTLDPTPDDAYTWSGTASVDRWGVAGGTHDVFLTDVLLRGTGPLTAST